MLMLLNGKLTCSLDLMNLQLYLHLNYHACTNLEKINRNILLFASTFSAIEGLNIVTTTISTIKVASSIVVAIITPAITFPRGELTNFWSL